MLNFKKIISVLLLFALVVSVFAFGAGASETTSETYTDDGNIVTESASSETSESSSVISLLSEEETEYSISDYKYGKYHTYFERLITNSDANTDDEYVAPVSTSSSYNSHPTKDFSTLFDWASGGTTRIEKLRLKGWFLTDGGVKRYVVRITGENTNSGTTAEYDVYNYESETNVTSGVQSKAEGDGYIDYAHNAHYDLDVNLEYYVNDKITVSVWAYTKKGESIQVLELSNVYVASSVLSTSDNHVCRYCNGEVIYGGIFPYYDSHNSCAKDFLCNSCQKSTVFMVDHTWSTDLTDAGLNYCTACGFKFGKSCPEEYNCSYTDLGDYHVKSYNCIGCGYVNEVEEHHLFTLRGGNCPHNDPSHCLYVETCDCCYAVLLETCGEHIWEDGECTICYSDCPHTDLSDCVCPTCGIAWHVNSQNGMCTDCGYECEHPDGSRYNIISDFVQDENSCWGREAFCSSCGIKRGDEIFEHNFVGGSCSRCEWKEGESSVCEHDYEHSSFEYVGAADICAYEYFVCANCNHKTSEIISSHVIENGVCIICEYSEDGSCVHYYDHVKFEYIGESDICAYSVYVCSKCKVEAREAITDHKLVNGKCEICGYESEHIYEDGVCIHCGKIDYSSKLLSGFDASSLAIFSMIAIIGFIILIVVALKKPRRRR